jgi:hypothetical protein
VIFSTTNSDTASNTKSDTALIPHLICAPLAPASTTPWPTSTALLSQNKERGAAIRCRKWDVRVFCGTRQVLAVLSAPGRMKNSSSWFEWPCLPMPFELKPQEKRLDENMLDFLFQNLTTDKIDFHPRCHHIVTKAYFLNLIL